MSWSITGSGNVRDVQKSVGDQFGRVNCSEPEQSIAKAAGALVDQALASYSDDKNVTVSGFGSQNTVNGTVVSNALSIKIEPTA